MDRNKRKDWKGKSNVDRNEYFQKFATFNSKTKIRLVRCYRIMDPNIGNYEKARGIRNVVLQTYAQNFIEGQNYQWTGYEKNRKGLWNKNNYKTQIRSHNAQQTSLQPATSYIIRQSIRKKKPRKEKNILAPQSSKMVQSIKLE